MFEKFVCALETLAEAESVFSTCAEELVHELCDAVERGWAVWVEAEREDDPDGGWLVTTEEAVVNKRRIHVDERKYGPRWRVTYCDTLEEAEMGEIVEVPVYGQIEVDYPDLDYALAMRK